MERLTDKRLALPPGVWQEVTREEARELKEIPAPSMRELYYRLSQIEDILGDDYDLDRLCELVRADRDGRCMVLPCPELGYGSTMGPPGVLGEPGIEAANRKWMYEIQEEAFAALKAWKKDG